MPAKATHNPCGEVTEKASACCQWAPGGTQAQGDGYWGVCSAFLLLMLCDLDKLHNLSVSQENCFIIYKIFHHF